MSQKTCRERELARGSLRREAKEIGSDRFTLSMREWSEIVRRNRMAILW